MSEPTEQKKEENTNYTRQLLIWGAVVLGFWLLYLAVLFWADDICAYFKYTPHINHSSTFGVFGDYFGALNAFFAGLAFAGIIVTIRQQSADLQATKKEMEEQTKQFARQTELIQKQIAKQEDNFREQRYFNLITRLDKVRSETNSQHPAKDFMNVIISLETHSFKKDLGTEIKKIEIGQLIRDFSYYFDAWEFVHLQMFELLAIIANDKTLSEHEKKTLALRLRNGFAIPDIQILAIISRVSKTQNAPHKTVKALEDFVLHTFREEIMIDFFINQGKATLHTRQNIPDEQIRTMALHFIQILETGSFAAIYTTP